MSGVTAVLDIGKTNVKVETFGPDGALVWERAIPNRMIPGPPYPHADVAQIWEFLLGALADANKVSPIAAIVPTTHGCAVTLIDEAGLVLPVMDYEFAGVDEIEPSYAPLRLPFSQTFSPRLPAGQNLRGSWPGSGSTAPSRSSGRDICWPIRNIGRGGCRVSRRPRLPRSARIPICGRRCRAAFPAWFRPSD